VKCPGQCGDVFEKKPVNTSLTATEAVEQTRGSCPGQLVARSVVPGWARGRRGVRAEEAVDVPGAPAHRRLHKT